MSLTDRSGWGAGLLVPSNLAAVVAKVVRELLPAFGHSFANPTNPSTLPAQVRPYLILLALGVVRHDEGV
jgi:H+/Cl- antiporter ClcA